MARRSIFSLPKSLFTKERLLNLAAQSENCQLLDSNEHQDKYSQFNWLIGWGKKAGLSENTNAFPKLRSFQNLHKDWLLGHLSYSLKDEIEDLSSQHSDPFNWPHLAFFVPETIIIETQGELSCQSYKYKHSEELEADLNFGEGPVKVKHPNFKACLTKEKYLNHIASLKEELQAGNIYEINFCQAWQAEGKINPVNLFLELNAQHKAPFSSFYRLDDRYLLCFSPERYLQKKGRKLISQPIKGTAARSKNKEEDAARKIGLLASEKERAENVMIVDLVRNDLSRTAAKASVKVDELFGLYTFNAVHQMISTISSQLHDKYDLPDVLETSFPMGSMTGAPKISAMKLIEAHENFNRGLYSGSVGYINPEGDADFNVIIRSIIYSEKSQLAEVKVGGAITIHCDAEEEYQECLLKAEKVIASSND
jgi:para-aminobenzoate synthetase component 1